MEKGHARGCLAAIERHDVLREGSDTLRALGHRELAREFRARGAALPSREELAELLLEYLLRARRG